MINCNLKKKEKEKSEIMLSKLFMICFRSEDKDFLNFFVVALKYFGYVTDLLYQKLNQSKS